ncbi:RNA-binding protein RO60-like [Mercenaria mercenaria]|uniref:RNA-binding protein RO60-like n=1 Tax=Mercenaria mercenaria TaxID=6596 RepID=UPI00234F12D2|nr:RNA-binding protein RO60-like [Mercenaria mercenaria]
MGLTRSKYATDYSIESWQPARKPGPSERAQRQQLTPKQVQNRSGAYVWEVNDMMKLQRFLFLGADNSFCYKAIDNEPKRENAQCIDRLIADGKGTDVVELIRDISLAGRAARQQPTMFALAICCRCNDPATKKKAYEALNEMCRIPTHLFMFVKYCEDVSSGTGWGRAQRHAIVNWYLNKCKNPVAVVRLLTKYKNREGWTHRDVLRLAHPKPTDDALKVVLKYIMKGFIEAKMLVDKEMGNDEKILKMLDFLEATEKAKRCTDEDEMVKMIREHGLEREHMPTQLLNSRKVWEALVMNLKMEAAIRNLGKISSMGLCGEGSFVEQAIASKLTDQQALKDARTHPFKVLLALTTYEKGRGEKGHLNWTPNKKVLDALDKAYYLSFAAVEPTGKRYLLAIDVSGSMNVPCVGSQTITCRHAAAAMMMVTARTEKNFDIVAFSHELMMMDIKKTDTLPQVLEKTEKLPFGGTDCALPMLWADEKKKKYDVFIVYTDSETWYGKVHPSRALQDYRVNMKIPDAKLIVVGMASNGFSIADPDDLGMLDIVGFDSAATQTIAKFSLGEV